MKSTTKAISSEIPVSQWMTRNVLTIELYDSLGVARRLMAKHRVNQLPVLDDGRLVGIVTDRDIRDAYPTSMVIDRTKEIDQFAETYTIEEVVTYNVLTVTPTTSLASAVKLLRRHRIGSLPVVENGKLVGILTRSDVLDFVLAGKTAKPRDHRKAQKARSSR